MIFAHLSDTHLGYRAYGRTTSYGINQRESDVLRTFRNCLDAIAERDPDVVVHSGDLFHVVRPSNITIYQAFKTISDFQVKRNGKPFILIGGNHDTPRMAESGNILSLFDQIPGMHVHTGNATAFEIPEFDLEVLAVPSESILNGEGVEWSPQFKRKFGLLTLHGIAREALAEAARFDLVATRHERWSYVAMGDFHEHKSYGRNICYAGSTDFASTNIWQEIRTPKGWVYFDTEKENAEFVKLQTRQVIDLPRIDAQDMATEALEASIRENARWDPEELPIVRQRVINVHADTRSRLSASLMRDLSAQCLTYVLRLNPPEISSGVAELSRGDVFSMEKTWEEHVATADIPLGTDRAVIKELGIDLLKEVAERASDPAKA